MIDSGLSYSMVPQEDINSIENALAQQGVKCEEDHNGGLDLYECGCPDEQYANLKPLETQVSGKTVSLPVGAYLKKKTDAPGKCTLLMHPFDVSTGVESKWVMGDQFMQNFYSIFDYKQKRIGLVEPATEIREVKLEY